MNGRILVIEDEAKMARMLELELTHEGYTVKKTFDGISGLQEAESGGYDLILLDLMLPGLSGMEVLRRLRKISNTPVILLTARDAIMDKVSGLDQGADDYITKPFAIEELLARIRTCLRKKAGAPEQTLSSQGLVLSPERHQVKYQDDVIELTLKEFELLQCLLENKGRVLSRNVLLNHVWGYDFQGETNAVDVYISFLREKIDYQFGIKLIHTVRGVGYQILDS
jgi:DNA-binding response OmpR family regulator